MIKSFDFFWNMWNNILVFHSWVNFRKKKSLREVATRTGSFYVFNIFFIRHFLIVTDFSSMQNLSARLLCGVFSIKKLTARLTFWAEKRNVWQRLNSSSVVQVSTSKFSMIHLIYSIVIFFSLHSKNCFKSVFFSALIAVYLPCILKPNEIPLTSPNSIKSTHTTPCKTVSSENWVIIR